MQTVGNAAIALLDDGKQPGMAVEEDTPIPASDVHASSSAQSEGARHAPEFEPEPAVIDVSHLITEDDTPVDSVYSEKLERLLTEPLYASWSGPPPQHEGQRRPFAAFSNVGLFHEVANTPIVPDVMLSIDVEIPKDMLLKENRSYFIWKYGKFPDVVIEIVSNNQGGELDDKLDKYALLGIRNYVVFDPLCVLGKITLHVFELQGGQYTPTSRTFFGTIGLGLVEWHGSYEGLDALWLRWCFSDGTLVPTGAERATMAETRAKNEKARADREKTRALDEKARALHEKTRADNEKARALHEKTRADNEKARADSAEERARLLADRLRALGLDPEGNG